jgi:hypothetical protein
MENNQKTPVWFWVIAGIAFLWNIMGLIAFFMQVTMSEETLAAMEATDRAMYENIPIWATAAFAIAVIAGTIGALGLLLRKKWAHPVFLVSLLGIVIQQIHIFFISGIMKNAEISTMIMPAMILLIAIFLLFFSKRMIRQGWLK